MSWRKKQKIMDTFLFCGLTYPRIILFFKSWLFLFLWLWIMFFWPSASAGRLVACVFWPWKGLPLLDRQNCHPCDFHRPQLGTWQPGFRIVFEVDFKSQKIDQNHILQIFVFEILQPFPTYFPSNCLWNFPILMSAKETEAQRSGSASSAARSGGPRRRQTFWCWTNSNMPSNIRQGERKIEIV